VAHGLRGNWHKGTRAERHSARAAHGYKVRRAHEHRSREARGQMGTRAQGHTAREAHTLEEEPTFREAHWQRGTQAGS